MRNHVVTFSACNVTNLSGMTASPGHRCFRGTQAFGRPHGYVLQSVESGLSICFIFWKKMLPFLHPNLKDQTWITPEIAATRGTHTRWCPPRWGLSSLWSVLCLRPWKLFSLLLTDTFHRGCSPMLREFSAVAGRRNEGKVRKILLKKAELYSGLIKITLNDGSCVLITNY